MIRLSSRVDDKFFNSLARTWVDFFSIGLELKTSFIGGLKFWETTRAKDYRYNFTYTDIYDNSFYFAFKHNSEKSNNGLHNFVVEYNPNKVNNDFFHMVLDNFILNPDHKYVRNQTFVSCDVCIDFPYNISNFILSPNGKRSFANFGEVNSDNKTYYLGKGNGRTKLYNKKIELLQKQGQYIDGELTRFEVSLEVKLEFGKIIEWELNQELPSLYYLSYDMITDVETKLMILGLLQAPELINQLTRRKKEKLEKQLENKLFFEFKEKDIKNLLTNYIIEIKNSKENLQ